eukprot:gene3516-4017_t
MHKSGLIKLLFADSWRSNRALHYYNLCKLKQAESKVTERLYVQFVERGQCWRDPVSTWTAPEDEMTRLYQSVNARDDAVAANELDDKKSPSKIIGENYAQLKRYETLFDSYYKVMYKLNPKIDVTIIPPIKCDTKSDIKVDALFVDPADLEHVAGEADGRRVVEIGGQAAYPSINYTSLYGRSDSSNLWTPPFLAGVLGGTFDRIHPGHKVLLTMAGMLCSEYMEVGVTDNSILRSKKYFELIAPFAERSNITKQFLHAVNPGVEYNMLRLLEPYANTCTSTRLQTIIISPETFKTAMYINEKRRESGLVPLERIGL